MGWRDSIAKFFGAPEIEKSVGLSGGVLYDFLRTSSSPRRGSEQLINDYNTSPWLRAVVGLIAQAVSAAEWYLYVAKRGGKGKEKAPFKSRQLQKMNRHERRKYLATHKDVELQEIEDHPMLDLLETPNDDMGGQELMQLLATHLEIKGEAFCIIERNNAGVPAQLWPVPPNWVQEIPTDSKPFFKIKMGNAAAKPVPKEDVIWMRNPDPADPYGRGSGVAMSLGDELDTDEYAAKLLKSYFLNGGTPELFVSVEGASIDEAARAKEKFEQENRGFSRRNRSFWHAGGIEVTKLGATFEELQMVELRKFERDTIVQVFGVPPELLGILEHSNRATIEAAMYIFAVRVLVPRLRKIRLELQRKLAPEFDPRLIVEHEDVVPADKEFVLKAASEIPWLFDVAELREFLDLPVRDNLDHIRMLPMAYTIQQTDTGEFMSTPANGDTEPKEADDDEEEPGEADPDYLERATKAKIKAPSEVEDALDALDSDELTSRLSPVWEERVQQWGERVMGDLPVDLRFNMLNPKVKEHLREFGGDRIGGLVDDTTRQKLKDTLVAGVQEGEGIDDLAKRVSSVFDEASNMRAQLIARTEVIRSSNFAAQSAFEQSGVVEARKWLATPDDRTRDEHLELNGEQADLSEPFEIGGLSAMYPGGFGDPEQDCNCRCTITPVVKEKALSASDLETWKKFDQHALSWERQAEKALVAGFRAQKSAVIAALRK